MSIIKLRGLGKTGIIADQDPYDLAVDAFSAGVNLRFRNNKITSGPVFRSVMSLGAAAPRFLVEAAPTKGLTELFIGYLDGSIDLYANGTLTDYTLPGYTASAVEASWTSTTLDGVVYVNRADRPPWYLLTTATSFANLGGTAPTGMVTNSATATTSPTLSFASVPTGLMIGMSAYTAAGLFVGYVSSWTTTTVTLTADAAVAVASGTTISFSGQWDNLWSCEILRQCSNALVALNVTKGPINYPNMVKTSSPVTNGQTPASWDINQANTLALENTLGSMDGPITDACSLGSDLVIYGRREAWRMHADGSTEVYDFTKLPFRKGSLNTNCSCELDGKNYVFGMDDMWVHDGVTEQSLCDQKVRDYVYGSMNLAQAYKNFVMFNPRLNEISFCYVSGDALVNYITGVDGCNRAAVYNITNGEWSFDDLPSIWYGVDAPLPNFMTYASTTATYATIGGSYQDQEDGDKRVATMVGTANTGYGLTNMLYAFDEYGTNSVAAFPVNQQATAPRYLERVGIDLHELQKELRGYTTVSTVWPQARVDTSGGNSLMVSVGASDNPSATSPTWGPYQPYDGVLNQKVDVNVAGRWLSVRYLWNDYRSWTLTGMDLDIKVTGHR